VRTGRGRYGRLRRAAHSNGQALTGQYRSLREGRPAIISFVTVAELRFGARLAGWGPGRLQRLEHEPERADTVWPGPSLVDTYATLRARCVKVGTGWDNGNTKRTAGSRYGHLAGQFTHRSRCDLRQRRESQPAHQTRLIDQEHVLSCVRARFPALRTVMVTRAPPGWREDRSRRAACSAPGIAGTTM
jgi:hypothetical protein